MDALTADQSESYYDPLGIGPHSPGVTLTSTVPSSDNNEFFSPKLTLNFSGFTSDAYFQFGADRADTIVGYFDDTADRISGTTYVATFTDGTSVTGAVANTAIHGYGPFDGWGLIDAQKSDPAGPLTLGIFQAHCFPRSAVETI